MRCLCLTGCYPYEKYPSVEALREAKSLPKIEDFYNSLTEEALDPKEYERAQKIWDFFEIKNMEEHMELYLQTNTFVM